MSAMVQLAITQALTPDTIVIRCVVDPYEPTAPTVVSAVVYAVDGSVLAAQSITLVGLEEDFLDSVVEAAMTSWRWGAPQQQLAPAMKRVKKAATRHRKLHERKA